MDAVDPHHVRGVVDAVEESVGASSSTVVAGQFASEWLADAARFARQVAESEFDDCRENSGRQLVKVTFGCSGESGRVNTIGVDHVSAGVVEPGTRLGSHPRRRFGRR